MPKFKKPSGAVIEVNDDNVAYAKSQGWTEVTAAKKKKTSKKKASKKS